MTVFILTLINIILPELSLLHHVALIKNAELLATHWPDWFKKMTQLVSRATTALTGDTREGLVGPSGVMSRVTSFNWSTIFHECVCQCVSVQHTCWSAVETVEDSQFIFIILMYIEAQRFLWLFCYSLVLVAQNLTSGSAVCNCGLTPSPSDGCKKNSKGVN